MEDFETIIDQKDELIRRLELMIRKLVEKYKIQKDGLVGKISTQEAKIEEIETKSGERKARAKRRKEVLGKVRGDRETLEVVLSETQHKCDKRTEVISAHAKKFVDLRSKHAKTLKKVEADTTKHKAEVAEYTNQLTMGKELYEAGAEKYYRDTTELHAHIDALGPHILDLLEEIEIRGGFADNLRLILRRYDNIINAKLEDLQTEIRSTRGLWVKITNWYKTGHFS